MNSAPRSITAPSPNGTDQTRPPTRSRASNTVTSAPPVRRASAAARPAKPAPMTPTRFIRRSLARAARPGSSQARPRLADSKPLMPGTDADKQRPIETEVIVIGGGIAGLTAATELAAAGTDVLVLEARDRVGGRTWNIEIGGEANELGGQWVAPYQSEMHELLAELEIELFPTFRTGEHVFVDRKGRSHHYEGHDAPLGEASEKAFEAAEAKLDSLAKEVDPEATWEHPDAERLDRITLETWIGDEITTAYAGELMQSWLAGGFLAKPAHTFSLLQGLWMIAGAGGTYELFEPEQCLAKRVVGGSQLIS